jgi:hypothetical protein
MKPNLDVAVLEDKGQPSLQGFRTTAMSIKVDLYAIMEA